jgi:hypothetical protein
MHHMIQHIHSCISTFCGVASSSCPFTCLVLLCLYRDPCTPATTWMSVVCFRSAAKNENVCALQAAVAEQDLSAQEQKAWELFAWLRQQEKFGLKQQPAELEVKAAQIRGDPLDFKKLTVCRQKSTHECADSEACTQLEHSETVPVPNTGAMAGLQ